MMGIRMPQKSRTRKSALAVLFAALGIALVIASSTAVFAADDDDDELWDVKMVRKFLRGFGLRNGQEAGIEYKERPPLVLPRGGDLPAPVAANSPAAANPAWPSDPDEKRRADQRRARKNGVGHRLDRIDTSAGGADGNPLKPSELDAGRTDKPGVKTGSQEPEPARGGRAELTPSQLGWTNSMWSGMVGLSKSFTGEKIVETGTFVREPSRTTLTDPPSGYRTPSPEQPYGINSKADRPNAKVRDHQATQ
jgi:hypothetical protein